MHRRHVMLCLLIALILTSIGPGDVRGAWPDGDLIGWNAPGMAVPGAPSSPIDNGMASICQASSERSAETTEDADVVAAGWRLTRLEERGSGMALVAGFINFDAMCRPVPYQWFAYVDGVFAGTLAPEPMYPRTDASLHDVEILDADRVRAVYDRYTPTDGLCCPSSQTVVTFRIDRTADGPVLVPEVGANSGDSGNTGLIAVCVGLGGDGFTLVEWTQEEVDDHEAQFGPAMRAHPTTGTCYDPAGIPLGDFGQPFSWVCATTADGLWYGPAWTLEMYRPATAVSPDPAIGGCPTPRDPRFMVTADTPQQAAATAVYLSQLEAAGDVDTLYTWLHPDAKTIVPKAAVVGWYTSNFLPLGPQPIRVTDVEITAWTWNVTGVTYEGTAVISFEQSFADGSVITDVVRLVQDDQGTWCWFFGRDAAFVNEQIDRYVE